MRLAVLFAAAVGVRLAMATWLVGQDDHFIIALSHEMAEGRLDPNPHHMWTRVGVLAPLALAGALTDWHPWSYAIYGFLCSLGIVALTYRIGRAWFSPQAGYAAAWVMAFFANNVHYAGAVHVDVPSSFWFLLAIHLIWPELPGVAGAIRPKPLWAAWCLGFAYLCKEVVVLGFAWLVIWYVVDRGSRRRLLWAAIAFGAIVALECACYWAYAGDPLHRFHGISAGTAASAQTGGESAFARWTWAFPRAMFEPSGHVGILFPLALAAILVMRRRAPGFLLGWIGLTAALIFWMPGLSDPTRPALNVAPRYLEPLAPPAALLIGLAISRCVRLQLAAIAALALHVAAGAYGAWAIKRDADRAIDPIRHAVRVLNREGATLVVSDPWTSGQISVLSRFRRRTVAFGAALPPPVRPVHAVYYHRGLQRSADLFGPADVRIDAVPIDETPEIMVYRLPWSTTIP